jgi:23S rRNA pseudouridine1911/1915/1917 synthase
LQQVFEHKRIRKEYRFVTDAAVLWNHFEVNDPIGKSTVHPVLRCINGANAKSAHTRFEKIGVLKSGGTVIRALPTTGRTHQIRVHSSSHGFAIRFDKFYSSYTSIPSEPLCLLSYSMTLKHPVTEQTLVVEMPDRLLPGWIVD